MKKKGTYIKLLIGAFLVVTIILGIGFAVSSDLVSKTVNEKKAVNGKQILSIKDIQADPLAYKGKITVTGVVADKSRYEKVPPDIFLMVDKLEAKLCKLTSCASFYLPVKFEEGQPKEWEEVNVTGVFAKDKLFLVPHSTKKVPEFEAEKVEKLGRLKF